MQLQNLLTMNITMLYNSVMETLKKILEAAEKEFLEHGFASASLRRIASAAGVTTGALYGYFPSKEAVFDSLVKDSYDALMTRYRQAHQDFRKLPFDSQLSDMGQISSSCIDWCLEYIYSHFDTFRLLICASEGTRYSLMTDEMVALEEESTEAFVSLLRENGMQIPEIDPLLSHMITSGFFSSFFEIVRHNVPHDEAVWYVSSLQAFNKAGWEKLLRIKL